MLGGLVAITGPCAFVASWSALLIGSIAGLLVIEATLLRIEASNRPGALGEVCARLARAKINIQYLYGSVGISTRAYLFLRVSDVPRAKKLLER
jgi:hypothetical protein